MPTDIFARISFGYVCVEFEFNCLELNWTRGHLDGTSRFWFSVVFGCWFLVGFALPSAFFATNKGGLLQKTDPNPTRTDMAGNVDPGLINPWLILIGGCPLLVGIETTLGGNTPPIMARVY